MRTEQGQVIHLKDYRPPEYEVLSVDLDIQLHSEQTIVRSTMKIRRAKDTPVGAALVLDGDELELLSITIEGNTIAEDAVSVISRPGNSQGCDVLPICTIRFN